MNKPCFDRCHAEQVTTATRNCTRSTVFQCILLVICTAQSSAAVSHEACLPSQNGCCPQRSCVTCCCAHEGCGCACEELGEAELEVRLCVLPQAPLIQPGLQHAILDEHKVCGQPPQRPQRLCGHQRPAAFEGDPALDCLDASPDTAFGRCTTRSTIVGDMETCWLRGCWVRGMLPVSPVQPRGPPSRRSEGVASTTACRSSLRVATTMGPGGPVTFCPRLMTACPHQQRATAC